MVQQEMRASRAEATQMAVAIKSAQRPPITEDFKITSVDDNGWVHGEKTEGTGEGIYYHEDLFVHFIGSKVQAGDEVAISWPAESYNNDEWNDIATIERIEK
jgi:hypothetical protein